MKSIRILPLIVGLALAPVLVAVQAQPAPTSTAAPMASPTRAQVKAERDAFMKTHRWDEPNEDWVLKSGAKSPPSGLTRAEAKTSRDEFLRNNRWQSQVGWVPIRQPRVLSVMSRPQVRAETQEFMRTHRYDDPTSTWVLRTGPMAR